MLGSVPLFKRCSSGVLACVGSSRFLPRLASCSVYSSLPYQTAHWLAWTNCAMPQLLLSMLNLLVVSPLLFGVGLFNAPLVSSQQHLSHNNSAAQACSDLQRRLGTTIIQTSTGPEYRNISSGAWNRHNALSQPACIALPTSSSDVQTVQRSIWSYGVRYAVQAGGHSAGAGWSR